MLAESDSAMYLAFMGTKMASDFMTNVNLWQEVRAGCISVFGPAHTRGCLAWETGVAM